jgi:hypothetical protein
MCDVGCGGGEDVRVELSWVGDFCGILILGGEGRGLVLYDGLGGRVLDFTIPSSRRWSIKWISLYFNEGGIILCIQDI